MDVTDLDQVAFDRTAPDREATRLEDLPRSKIDPSFATGRALWIVPRVAPYRPLVLALPVFDIRPFDALEDRARALRFAHTELLRRSRPLRNLRALAQEGWRMRRQMMSYAEALSHKGRFAPELIARLRAGAGYLALVADLSVLVGELRDLPAELIGPMAAVTRADLLRASEIADEISRQVGHTEVDLGRKSLVEERRKLEALLLVSHGQVRRAITFLRWDEGDAARIVPSLHVPPGSRKKKAGEPRESGEDPVEVE